MQLNDPSQNEDNSTLNPMHMTHKEFSNKMSQKDEACGSLSVVERFLPKNAAPQMFRETFQKIK